MTDAAQTDEDDIALAGEYVLHLMDADARRAFERRLVQEPELPALVRAWDESFVSLADHIPSETPPAEIKARVENSLFDRSNPSRRSGWFWLSAVGGVLTAAVLAVAVVLMVEFPARGPSLTAEIAAEDRSFVFEARFDASRGTLEVERLAGTPFAGRVQELWLIAEGASAPVSLGVVPQGARPTLEIPTALVPDLAGATLAVSDEPPGGSPTGQPTGAVLAIGAVEAG